MAPASCRTLLLCVFYVLSIIIIIIIVITMFTIHITIALLLLVSFLNNYSSYIGRRGGCLRGARPGSETRPGARRHGGAAAGARV